MPPRKTVETVQPTETVETNESMTQQTASNLVTGITDTDRAAIIAKFSSPEYAGTSISFPNITVLNKDEPNHGLFIKQSVINQIGWSGPEPTHKNKFSDGNAEIGYLTQHPRMHILAISPRFIELRKDIFGHPLLGDAKKGAIVGNYEVPGGKELREDLGRDATLRTLYLVYLLDENNNKMHKIPLCLPIHGTAATEFGKHYTMFCRQLESAFADWAGIGYAAKDQNFHGLGVFAPVFASELQGDEQKSPVCTCVGFDPVTKDNLLQYWLHEREQEFTALARSSSDFASRYFQSFAQYHQVLGGVEMKALEAAPVDTVGDDEFTGTTVTVGTVLEAQRMERGLGDW